MRTEFAPERLADPAMATSEAVIRKCVHCGFCTATKEMLEGDAAPTADVVKHIDRCLSCLSCLSCMTTCPSGVNYMHLVDHARAYIEARYRRPVHERLLRALLAAVLPHPRRFRAALALARLARPAAPLFAETSALKPFAAMLSLAPRRLPPPMPAQDARPAAPKGRVVLLQGCAEPVLAPQIRAATVRLLTRTGYAVSLAAGEGCCGALVHHMGREAAALDAARRNVDAWTREIDKGGLDAILVTTSGCGTTIKDYGFMLRADPAYATKAAAVSALAKDISEFLAGVALPPAALGRGLRVAYHPACSLQHGQKVTAAPQRLLSAAGFTVCLPAESHLCCGSAGVYNILQPDIAGQLGARKAAELDCLEPDVIATGNVGCAVQIGRFTGAPVVHTVELLDWATGGPRPDALDALAVSEFIRPRTP